MSANENDAALAARLDRIKTLTDELARVRGGIRNCARVGRADQARDPGDAIRWLEIAERPLEPKMSARSHAEGAFAADFADR
jgi:hypothetical protein